MQSSNNKRKGFSIRLKLTLTYSAIVFVFSSLLILSINIVISNYMQKEPNLHEMNVALQDTLRPMACQCKDELRYVRDLDLLRLRRVSVYSLIPLTVLSFLIGYYLSGKFLYPLKILSKKIGSMGDKQLGEQIDIYSDDEIGEIAKNFNKMSVRLRNSFDRQQQFIQDASHELRTPLTIIQTNLEQVSVSKKSGIDEYKEAVERSLKGIKMINKLSDNLLDLTNNELQLEKNVSIQALLEDVLKSLDDFAKSNKVEIVLNFEKDIIKRDIDKEKFKRAMYNLFHNAIKYSATVSNPKVIISLNAYKNKKNVIISIKDNGIGIPKEKQKFIFDRFYRVDKSRSRESGGTGLGLSITKQIIEDHGGEISFKSEKDKGTEFFVTI